MHLRIKHSVLAWISASIVILAVFLVYQTGSAPAPTSSQPISTAGTTSPAPSVHSLMQPAVPVPTGSAPAPSTPALDASLTDPSSVHVIVNKQHPLNPLSYAPGDLVSVGNGQSMRAEAAAALGKMIADAAAAGLTLTPDSGYRSYSTQVSTYGSIVNSYGQAYADTVSARPGYSEHQSGWAMDIGTNGCHIDNCFAGTPAGQWTKANAYKYGFLLRYPDGLTDTTGYAYESWHYRYIGLALAEAMHSKSIPSMEQYYGVSGGTVYK